MTLIVILSLFAAFVAIAAYQLIVHKYYWGPAGPPKSSEQSQKDNED
ncbi:MAG TPA: hypothetical protein VN920_05390 [Pyrinomonadaceae bacterium]|nr:hypothetical protein [Pyrinomonadaceae bacterium]